MSQEDARKWNQRYRENARPSYTQPRKYLMEILDELPSQGLALDAAMGLGGNAGVLMEKGLRVIGVDISEVGVRRAKDRLPNLIALVADLSYFYFPPKAFDVILNFYFLERDLWPRYADSLQPGGILVIETMTRPTQAYRPDIDSRYLLDPGELRSSIASLGLDILHYRESWTKGRSGTPRAVASLLARSPQVNS
jgi:SAM-dependent methyltransferase